MEGKRRLEVTRLSLIDVSFEDDCLIPSPSGDVSDLHSSGHCIGLSEANYGPERDDATDIKEQIEQPIISTEPLELTRATRVGKCNLRKSLAWDNAFFTSEGVLDPEELAIVNKTFNKAEIHSLPGIQEELRRSVDSISTLDSESFELQSLEVDLFVQAEASIQKSEDENDKAFVLTYAGTKAESKAEDIPNLSYLDQCSLSVSADLELDSRERLKPVAASKEHNVSKPMPGKTSKESLLRHGEATVKSGEEKYLMPPKIISRANSHPLSMAPTERKTLAFEGLKTTSRRASSVAGDLEQGACQRMKPVIASKGHTISKNMSEKKSKESIIRQGVAAVKNMEQKSLMPPKILSRANSRPLSIAPAEQKTLAYEGIKCTSGMASSGNLGNKRLVIPQKPISGDPTSARSTPSPRSSSSGSPHSSMSPHSFSSSSFGRSGSTSSGSMVNTPQRTVKYKPESRKPNLSPTDSSVDPRLKTLRNKLDFRNGQLLASRIPTSRFSPSSSPASSFDSSDSSSSVSTNQRPKDSEAGPDITVPSSLPGFKISGTGLLSHSVEKSHPRNGGFCQPAPSNASLSCSDNKSGTHSFKPSGLRMPSPKIGFFDSASIPPKRNLPTLHPHSRLPSTLPRNPLGIDNCGAAVKPKSSKLLSIRPVSPTGYMKLSSNRTGSPYCNSPASSIKAASPAMLQQLPSPVPSVKFTENRPGTALKAHKDLSVRIDGKMHLGKSQKVAAEVTGTAKLALYSCLSKEECTNQTVLKNNMGAERQEVVRLKATGISSANDEEPLNSGKACHDGNDENIVQIWKDETGNNLDSASFVESVPNMEDCHQFEDQADGLVRLVEGINLNTNTLTELTGQTVLSLPHSAELSVFDQKVDFMHGLPHLSSLSVSPTKIPSRSSGRSPLDTKNSFCKSSGLCEPKIESAREKAMDKSSTFPFAEKDTNLPVSAAYSSPIIELGQKNTISRKFCEEISKNNSSIHELHKQNDFENCCISSPVSQSLAFLH